MTVGSQTIIEGKNVEITEAIREYAEAKLERVHNHFDSLIQNHDIRVVVSVPHGKGDAKKTQKVEITINLKGGHVIRSEAKEDSVYAAIDVSIDKLEKQFRKYKTRIYSKIHHGKSVKDYGLKDIDESVVPAELLEQISEYSRPKVIKTKRFVMSPMEPEEAIEMLKDCGHPFYMFLNVFSNKIACIYQRDDGEFGMIEPEYLQVNN